jgi:ATP-binding cassette subfamily B protein
VKPLLWWLVAAEFAIAIFGSILGRTIDYVDALLADKYTRHISIRDETRRGAGSHGL